MEQDIEIEIWLINPDKINSRQLIELCIELEYDLLDNKYEPLDN